MFRFLSIVALMGVLALSLPPVSSQEGEGEAPAPPTAGKAQESPQGGAFAGRILFEGKVPPPRKITVNKDPDSCSGAAREVQDVIVHSDDGKTLADVIVEIEFEKGRKFEWKHPEEGYVITQKGCRFEPHIFVVPSGAELKIVNDDPIVHNINTGRWNIAQKEQSIRTRKIKYRRRSFVRVNCNIHNWMESWMYIARSPYYSRTGGDGKFKIENVPPGSYSAIASHPTLGKKKLKVTIESGKTAEQDVTFVSPVKE